ncbi:hypothetical protein H0H93_011079 [Arthromyces matolae]|nr:hypothetical protein H0H93_011079 [Arthromyces matolae]
MVDIKMENISRTEFIKQFLSVFNLATHFSPGVHSGPDFKFWFTGINKTGAATIQTDHDFDVVAKALLSKDRRGRCQVNVEFDIDTMDGFRIKQPAQLSTTSQTSSNEEELLYGTRVPSLENYSVTTQLHGQWIKQLKEKYPCASHTGEHGENGFCFVTGGGKHIGLNNRRLKAWAAAIAAGDATKSMPPNIPEFDGARDGGDGAPRTRGRTGPFSTSSSSASGPVDQSTLLFSALIASLQRGRSRSRSPRPSTPVKRRREETMVFSSPPEAGTEIEACLRDFAKDKAIDMIGAGSTLRDLELTPDIIPQVPVARLCEITEAHEGRVLKLQQFCTQWQTRYEAKLEASATKKSRKE